MNTKKLTLVGIALLAFAVLVPNLSAQENKQSRYLNAGREMKIVNGAEHNAKVLEYICECVGDACRCVKDFFVSATKNIPEGYVPGREGAIMRTSQILLEKKNNSLQKALEKANLSAAQQAKEKENKKVCAKCAKPISHKGQHCQAKDYTGLCMTAEELAKTQQEQTKPVDENLPKCKHCQQPISSAEQECSAKRYDEYCEPQQPETAAQQTENKPTLRCVECGRTKEDVAKHGHNHKGPYTFSAF